MKIDIKKLALLLLIITLVVFGIVNREHINKENLDTLLTGLGVWAPLVFIAIYSLAPVIFFPGTILTLLAGFLFGPLWGTIYVLIGATIGSSLAFLTARYIASDWVEGHTHGMLTKIKAGVEEQGWRFVAFTRLVPLFPFTILNYAFGLTKIPLITYALSSFIFMAPGTFAYVYIGYVGQEAASGSKDLILKISIALGFLLFISFIPKLLNKKEKNNAINNKTG